MSREIVTELDRLKTRVYNLGQSRFSCQNKIRIAIDDLEDLQNQLQNSTDYNGLPIHTALEKTIKGLKNATNDLREDW